MRLPQTENLTCCHVSVKTRDIADIKSFEIAHPETGAGLDRYLKYHALFDEHSGVMRTYLVRFKSTHECVGYFSLKAGLVSVNEERASDGITFDTVPGVELANFAVNNAFVQKHNTKGLGYLLFSGLIAPFVLEHAKTLGIYMIYLFALPYEPLMKTYESYGFHRLPHKAEEQLHQRLKPAYDESCIFMYQLLHEMRHG